MNFGYSFQVVAAWIKSLSRQWRHCLYLIRRISHRLGGAGEHIAKLLVTFVLASKAAYAAPFYSLKRVHVGSTVRPVEPFSASLDTHKS